MALEELPFESVFDRLTDGQTFSHLVLGPTVKLYFHS